jgi:hypothetical protein
MKQPVRRSRMLGWDRNPLRRRVDRVEAGMVAGLILVFLITAPVLVAVAGHWVRTAGIRQQRAEASWRQVPATLQQSAPAQRDDSLGMADTVKKPARWTAPDGQPRNGRVAVSPQAAAGSTVRVWVSRSGSLTGWPPLRRAQLQGRIVIAGVLTAAVLGLALCLAGIAGRLLFSRRRLANWDKAWRAVGPHWTRQL